MTKYSLPDPSALPALDSFREDLGSILFPARRLIYVRSLQTLAIADHVVHGISLEPIKKNRWWNAQQIRISSLLSNVPILLDLLLLIRGQFLPVPFEFGVFHGA
jgi:hypothetical protein